MSEQRRAIKAFLLASLLTVGSGCGGAAQQMASSTGSVVGTGEPAVFNYILPEGGALGSSALRGRDTVLLFATTYDAVSLAVARRLIDLGRTRRPRINIVVVALEPPQNAPLVAVYRDSMNGALPTVLADLDTLEGRGAFGDMRQVPGLVLLDRDGRVAYRGFGPEAYRVVEERLGATAEPQ